MRSSTALIQALLIPLLFASCTIRYRIHPVVEIDSNGKREMGVSTSDGILFLGNTAQEGLVTVLLYFGDIPYQETARVVPAGGGLFKLDLDVNHKGVPISLEYVRKNEDYLLMGMKDGHVFSAWTRIAGDPEALGDVYEMPGSIDPANPPIGAGLFRVDKHDDLSLVGIVKGTATLRTRDGAVKRWLCTVGQEAFKNCMVKKQKILPNRKLIHRPDLDRPTIKR